MSQQRLVLFLSDVEASLTTLCKTLKGLCDEAGLPPPEVRWVEGIDGLADAGWQVAEVLPPPRLAREQASQALGLMEEHLDVLTRTVAKDFRERAVCLFADRASSYARVCSSGPGHKDKATEGEYLDVLRQSAKWLDVESATLARLMGGAQRNELAAAVDFGQEAARPGSAPVLPAEPDEDDRFVDAKLGEARQLMERYLSSQRK